MNKEQNAGNLPFPAGRFDRSFNLIDGNKLLYDMIGENLYSSLYKMLLDEDHRKITSAMESCDKNQDGEVDKTIHIVNKDGGYDKYVISMRKCENQDYFFTTFVNVSDSERIINEIEGKLMEARDLLTISGNVLFEYDKNTNHFHLFWMDHEQKITISKMDFDEWIELVKKEKMVEGEELQTFLAMAQAIRSQDDGQSFVFKGTIITKGDRLDSYHIKMVARNYGGQDMVVGIWSVMNEVTGQEIENFFEDSYMDPLSRILNKKSITEYAQHAVAKGPDHPVAIAVMDIDNFKNVNDTFGHMFGDKVIRATADVIKQAVGTTAVAGRMGGDEFMIVFENYQDELTLRNMLRCIKTNMANIYQGKMGANRLSCSMGVSRFDRDADNFKELFQIADKCLYIAKQKGKNRYIIYEPEKHGDFVVSSKSADIVEMRGNFYAESDIFRINQLLFNVVLYGDSYLQTLLDQVAYTLMLDRVSLFWGDSLQCRCTNEGSAGYGFIDPMIIRNEKFLGLFREDMLPLNNINTLEYNIPEVYEILKNSSAYSSLLHLLRDSNGMVRGVLCGDTCKNFVTFPQVAIQIFENLSEVVNAVLIRDESLE